MQPELRSRPEAGHDIPVLVWRCPTPMLMIASGPLGGGLGRRDWVLNATVPMSYDRDDPDRHLAEIAVGLGLPEGLGVGLLTGVDVGRYVVATDGGVEVTATVGLGAPEWAAAPDGDPRRVEPGTINIMARMPVRLSEAGLVNAVATATEAKAQALWDLAVPATGTCTDATCLSCPTEGPVEPYGGPRSTWGARLARAVHAAVLAGGRNWLATPKSWSATVGSAS